MDVRGGCYDAMEVDEIEAEGEQRIDDTFGDVYLDGVLLDRENGFKIMLDKVIRFSERIGTAGFLEEVEGGRGAAPGA
jgi:hypothetical protein